VLGQAPPSGFFPIVIRKRGEHIHGAETQGPFREKMNCENFNLDGNTKLLPNSCNRTEDIDKRAISRLGPITFAVKQYLDNREIFMLSQTRNTISAPERLTSQPGRSIGHNIGKALSLVSFSR
jgi:hypothetical protein